MMRNGRGKFLRRQMRAATSNIVLTGTNEGTLCEVDDDEGERAGFYNYDFPGG